MKGKRKPLTWRIGDDPVLSAILEQAKSNIDKAEATFRRSINNVPVTEAEYLEWRDNGGERGSR